MDDQPSIVTVYGAEWCPPCHTTKSYLKSRGIGYKYVNIDEEREQARAVAEKTGWTAIPIIQIGEEYILGFDRPKIDAALQVNKLI